jgi:hypothetical protein
VNKQFHKGNGRPKVSNGIAFDKIASADQDEISKYLFWEIAPKEGEVLRLTHRSQREARVELDQRVVNRSRAVNGNQIAIAEPQAGDQSQSQPKAGKMKAGSQ